MNSGRKVYVGEVEFGNSETIAMELRVCPWMIKIYIFETVVVEIEGEC